MNKANSKLSPKNILQITNTLRLIGLKSSHKGTKLINKAIQYIILNDIEFFTMEEVYSYLHHLYNFNELTIKSNINNAINNRVKKISENNFEKVFNYDYDILIFEPKALIEELANVIKTKTINE